MLTHTFVGRAGFLFVFIAAIGWAGTGFADEKGTGTELRSEPVPKSKKTGAEIPRELAMRPLPTYRIEPPDILQIEVTCSKAAQGEQPQPTKKTDKETPSGGAENAPGDAGIKAEAGAINKIEAGGQAENKVDTIISNSEESSTTVSAGTLTLRSSNTYSGGTVVSGGSGPAGTATVTGTLKVSGANFDITPANSGTYVFQGGTNPGTTFTLGNATPSAGRVTITRTGRGVSGAELGSGQYLVGPDGTINMRQYGMVQVMGMTVAELKAALEKHLSKYMESPEVWINVLGFNSKVYYIITDGAGYGDNVRRIPICGNETVLDAMASVGGLSQFSSRKIWLSRPSPTNARKGTILPIDYAAITQRGATETNYQIIPGDRIFIAGDGAIAFNNKLGKVTAPVERMMGVISLGASTIRSVKQLFSDDEDRQEAAGWW